MGLVDKLLVPFYMERYKDEIAISVNELLSEIGEDRVRFLVETECSMWSIWPNKAGLASWAEPYRDIIGRIDLNEVAARLVEILSSTAFAFVTPAWVVTTLREARRDFLKSVVK